MAFDISKITSAVNSYLYSISDVNKLLTEETQTDSSTSLAGIFSKYLGKALEEESGEATGTDSAVLDTTAITGASAVTGSTAEETAAFLSLSLPDLVSENVTKSYGTYSDINVAAARKAAREAAQKAEEVDALKQRITGAFDGLDIKGEIEESINSHNRINEINEINSYNASRIKSYKLKPDTSIFGDFKL